MVDLTREGMVELRIDPALRPSKALSGLDEVLYGDTVTCTLRIPEGATGDPVVVVGRTGMPLVAATDGADHNGTWTCNLAFTTVNLGELFAGAARVEARLQVSIPGVGAYWRDILILRGAWDGPSAGAPTLTLRDYAALETLLADEETRASGAEASLSTAILSESSDRIAAISAELSARSTSDSSLSTACSIAQSSEASSRTLADAALSSAISSETSARLSSDSALLSAISSESTLARVAESALSTAIASEQSNRIAADAGKAPLSHTHAQADVVGLIAALSTLTSADTAETSSRVSADAVLSAAISSEVSRAKSVEAGKEPSIATDGNTWKTLRGDKVFRDPINVANTATLLALTPAQAFSLRFCAVDNCYRTDGTIGWNLCMWKGDSSAGVWVLADAPGVPMTTSRIVFLRGLAKAGLRIRSAKLYARPMSRHGAQDFSYVTSGSGAGVGAWSTGVDQLYWSASTAGGSAHRAPYQDSLIVGATKEHYYRDLIQVSRLGTASDNAMSWLGFVEYSITYPTSGTSRQAIAVIDTQNGGGLLAAPTANISFITGNGTNKTETPTTVDPTVGHWLEIHIRGTSAVDFYLDEVLVASHSTNLPTGEQYMWDEGIRATAYASAPTQLTTQEIYQACFIP